ncbi:terpenoid synthase, partial [Fistulina hepatica ATCC 64428]
YVIYIDDTAPKKPQAFEEFEYRILHNLPQLDPVLRAFEVILKRMWDIYDPPCARSIFSSVMQFTVFACIEPTMQQTGELVVGAQRLPWFIRQRSGLGVAYACFTFPKNLNLPFMEYVQAIPDMEYWIDVANDLFSFYKEEIVGEDTNFAHTRARVDHKSAMQVVGEFVEELLTCRSVIHTVLGRHPEILKIWIASENGYIAWHLSQARYRLQEIGLSV